MHILIGWQSTEVFLYVIGKSNMLIMDIYGKHYFKLFYYKHINEIPSNNGANSYKQNILKIVN